MRVQRYFVIPVLLCAGSPFAIAHTTPRSASDWVIDGETVRVTYVVPGTEVVRRWSPGGSRPSEAELATYLSKRFEVSRAGTPCRSERTPDVAVRPTDLSAVAEMTFTCGSLGVLTLSSTAFFDSSPSHTQLARVESPASSARIVAEFAFTRGSPTHHIEVDHAAPQSPIATVAQFIYIGVMHIATGPDHLAFLLGLILMAASWRRLLVLTSGFTIGHSVTLLLAATGRVSPRASTIEALVAFTVLVVALEAVGRQFCSRAIPMVSCGLVLAAAAALVPVAEPLWQLWTLCTGLLLVSLAFFYFVFEYPAKDICIQSAITLVFGLVHGAAFASGLLEYQVSRQLLVPALAGFNVGVEVGQLVFVGLALLAAAGTARIVRTPHLVAANTLLALGLACVSVCWFIERIGVL